MLFNYVTHMYSRWYVTSYSFNTIWFMKEYDASWIFPNESIHLSCRPTSKLESKLLSWCLDRWSHRNWKSTISRILFVNTLVRISNSVSYVKKNDSKLVEWLWPIFCSCILFVFTIKWNHYDTNWQWYKKWNRIIDVRFIYQNYIDSNIWAVTCSLNFHDISTYLRQSVYSVIVTSDKNNDTNEYIDIWAKHWRIIITLPIFFFPISLFNYFVLTSIYLQETDCLS